MATANNNPFVGDSDDDTPSFANTRAVIDDPEFHSSFDDHTSYGGLTATTNFSSSYEEVETRRVSDDSVDSTVRIVIKQPQRQNIDQNPRREELPVHRRQIPVYTLGWTSTSQSQFMPATGLDFLTGVHEVFLQQTVVNFSDPSEKRYIIKVPNGETLYGTLENSRQLERNCCGSQRSFVMTLLDHTQQEAARLTKNVGCALSWFPCILQELLVHVPGHNYIGKVKQDLSISSNSFTIYDKNDLTLYRLFGPNICSWTVPLDAIFSLVGGDGGGRLGVISRKWNNSHGDYNLHITFPAPGLSNEHKMLILGAAFLVEYMYFEHRSKFCLRIC